MSILVGGEGGEGGGGGGFTLGPEQNVFLGVDRTAAELARDTYFSGAGAANLLEYNADTTLNIRLEYTDTGNAIALFQVRNVAGDAWLDNSSATGVKGDAGATASVSDAIYGPAWDGETAISASKNSVYDKIELLDSSKVSADGSVTTHNDVTSAGSGIIISDAERDKVDNLSGVNTGDQTATTTSYDNTTSGLTATNVKTAIDELDTSVDLNNAHRAVVSGNPHNVLLSEIGGTTDHTALSNIGTTSHADIDSHIANVTTNPHAVTKTNVGLSDVPNTDFTTPVANNTAHRGLVAGNPHAVTKAEVGLGLVANADTTNADNISDGTTNAIVTLTQEANFETAYTHSTSTANPHGVTLEQARAELAILQGDVDFNNNNIVDVQGIGFQGGQQITWNPDDLTINVPTGLGPVNQVGQEVYSIVYNGSGVDIEDGKVIHAIGAFNNRPSVQKAIADTYLGFRNRIAVATMLIPDGTYGIVTGIGRVTDVNTNDWLVGDTLYLSATTAGEMVNVAPEFPNYSVQVAGVITKDAINGVLNIAISDDSHNTTINFWNGVFRESFVFSLTSDGATITGSLAPTDGNVDMTMMFSSGFALFDTSPPATVVLTAGTDSIPQTNYVYILESTKALTISTSEWPTVEHIKVSTCIVQSALKVKLEGALKNHNYNDHIQGVNGQGHLSHITEKVRQFDAQWDSGTEGSVVIGAADEVWLENTSGKVYQLHKQNFLAQSMVQYVIDAVSTVAKTFTISGDGDLTAKFPVGRDVGVHNSTGNDGMYTVASTVYSAPNFIITVEEVIPSAVADGTMGDDVHVVNDFAGAYTETTDLSTVTTDALGGALNNTSFSVVVWGVANQSGETSHLMANMPSATYNKTSPELAVSDAQNFSIYTIPKDYRGTGFLIMRVTFINNGGTWSVFDTEDLRGKLPNITAGGGAGGTGVTTFLGLTDTPSAYTGQALRSPRVNAGETALEFVDAPLGDVVGPAGAVDDNVATFDLATGKLIQDSGIAIANVFNKALDDADDVDDSTSVNKFTTAAELADLALNVTHRTSTGEDHTYIDQDVTTVGVPTFASVTVGDDGLIATTNTEGRIFTSDGDKFNNVAMSGDATIDASGAITVNGGDADTVILVAKVDELGGIPKGAVVYINAASGGLPQIQLADNTNFAKAAVLAMANETGAYNDVINITTSGLVHNLNTLGCVEGEIIYLGAAGAFTNVHPTGIDAVQRIGNCVTVDATVGSVLIQLNSLTFVNDHDGTVRHQLVNQNAGAASLVSYTMVNDAGRRASIAYSGSNFTNNDEDVMLVYNEGYGRTTFIVDGNQGFEWSTDVTDSHNVSATPKMTLTASGDLSMTTGGSYQVNAVDVLTNDTLGSTVVNSSLTNVGTLTDLTVSGDVSAPIVDGLLGVVNKLPEVSIPFTNKVIDTLSGFMTVERGTTTGNINFSGTRETVAIDEVAITKDGVSVYEGYINALLHSGDITQPQWTKSGTSIGAAALGQELIEDGGNTEHFLRQIVSPANTGFYGVSFKVKLGNGAARAVRIRLADSSGFLGASYLNLTTATMYATSAGVFAKTKELNDGWVEFSAYIATITGINPQASVYLVEEDATATIYQGDSTSSVFVDELQLTTTEGRRPYMATTTVAGQRFAEQISIDMDGNMPAVGKPFTIMCDCTDIPLSDAKNAFIFSGSSTFYARRQVSTGAIQFSTGGGVVSSVGDFDTVNGVRFHFVYDGVDALLYANGELLDSGVSTAPVYDVNDSLAIGSYYTFIQRVNSEIKHFEIYHEALSADTIKAKGAA